MGDDPHDGYFAAMLFFDACFFLYYMEAWVVDTAAALLQPSLHRQ
jgi:hypothetical protein